MKKWSWHLGSLAGIGVYIHATFLLLLGWVGLVYWLQAGTITAVASGLMFILAIFACVLFHEFGHAFAARRYGIPTRSITLLPIGGVALLERMPEDPIEEVWVALAGPAVNLVIAGLIFAGLSGTGGLLAVEELSVTAGSFWQRLMLVNVLLVVFNLVPAFPMDGGRILRGLLALRMPHHQATQIAATLGQGLALVFGLVGLFTNPFLVFIALFVWIGARQEAGSVQLKTALAGITVEQAMMSDYRTLHVDDPLEQAVDLLLSGSQQDFPVLGDDDQVVGILGRTALIEALARGGTDRPVGEVMNRAVPIAAPNDMLDLALSKLQNKSTPAVPVVRDGILVGLLTAENVGEFIHIQSTSST